jgi:putative MFS transporter
VTPLDTYQKRLIVFLSVATFFEGYDFFALAQLLPTLRAEFGLSKTGAGLLLTVVNFGTVLAAGLVRLADRWGRRRVLTLTILGYTACSLLTAATSSAWSFGLAQLAARVFLLGEWAVANVMAAEEFPADRRGTVIGVIQASASLGAIVCAGLVPLLVRAPLGWRTVYVAGALPLVLTAFARRNLQETRRFREQSEAPPRTSPLALLRGPWGRRVWQLGLLWSLTYLCTQNAITFWKEFAVEERHWSDAQVGVSLTIAAVVALPLLFVTGRLIDGLGRRRSSVLLFSLASVGVVAAYLLHGRVALTVALAVGFYGTSAILSVLNAYNAELFPTHLRGDAFAVANHAIGRISYVASPLLVGWLAEGLGWGVSVAATAVGPLMALGLILAVMPETSGRELEDTARC